MGHVAQDLFVVHHSEECGGQGHDGRDQLLLDQPVHQVGDVTKKLLHKDSIQTPLNHCKAFPGSDSETFQQQFICQKNKCIYLILEM